ncbi:MAG: hypothetical protein CL883_05525 [Dehalococcoidia bacterium]|nr:hypothetical protein [Dehalococcoidia bacterium]
MTYDEETTEHIKKEYEADPTRATVDRLAAELEVSPRSVIGKLASMGVYQAPKRVRKDGKKVELKRDLAAEIGEFFGLELPSLEKAEREELRSLRDAIRDPLNLKALLVDYG